MAIRYTSKISSEHLDALQQLMFFNEKQHHYRAGIMASIEEFGEPMIINEDGFLRVRTSRLGEVQALYALAEAGHEMQPVGAMLYTRSAEDTLTLLHIGVHKDFTNEGRHGEELVMMNLMRRLIELGRRVKYIRKLIVLYGAKNRTEIPIRP
jgi:hypothetical protein